MIRCVVQVDFVVNKPTLLAANLLSWARTVQVTPPLLLSPYLLRAPRIYTEVIQSTTQSACISPTFHPSRLNGCNGTSWKLPQPCVL